MALPFPEGASVRKIEPWHLVPRAWTLRTQEQTPGSHVLDLIHMSHQSRKPMETEQPAVFRGSVGDSRWLDFTGGSEVNNPPAMQEMTVQSLCGEDSPRGGSGSPLQYPCLGNLTEEPGGLVPWAARRSNQSILQEINPEYSLEGLKLKLKLKL